LSITTPASHHFQFYLFVYKLRRASSPPCCHYWFTNNNLALTSPTSGGRSLGIVCSRTKARSQVKSIFIHHVLTCLWYVSVINSIHLYYFNSSLDVVIEAKAQETFHSVILFCKRSVATEVVHLPKSTAHYIKTLNYVLLLSSPHKFTRPTWCYY
jgi:hypothetical protein